MLKLQKLKHLQLKENKLTKIEEVASALHEELLNHPLVKEYKKYKEMIDSNPIYKLKDKEIRAMQKEIINNYSLELVNEYKRKKDEFFKDEVLSKYLSLKEELNNLLLNLQDIINYNL